MHVKNLSQGLNIDLAQPGLEPRTSWSQSQVPTTRPQRHIAYMTTKILGVQRRPQWQEITTHVHLRSFKVNFLKRHWLREAGMGTGKGKKKPEVKILDDYCWRKYNIFHQKKILNSDQNLRSPIPGEDTTFVFWGHDKFLYLPAKASNPSVPAPPGGQPCRLKEKFKCQTLLQFQLVCLILCHLLIQPEVGVNCPQLILREGFVIRASQFIIWWESAVTKYPLIRHTWILSTE